MRAIFLVAVSLFSLASASKAEIREFDIPTIERLGNELARVSRTSTRGATTPIRKRAKQTATEALKGRLFDINYDYVVLDDPDGKGFLVYALGSTNNPDEIVLAGHFRVTVSADGAKAEQVDALSRGLVINNKKQVPPGAEIYGMYMIQLVSSKPVETLVYTYRLKGVPIYVTTNPGGEIWKIENGKIKDTGKSVQKK